MKKQMKRFITTALTILLIAVSYAQTAPDQDHIEYEVTNPASKFYYPSLIQRYHKSDTTLTFDDYFHLYYGYATQDNYKPLLKTNYSDSLSMIFNARRAISGDEFSKIERYAIAVLSIEPFNLRDINVLAYAYQQIGYLDKAELQRYKLKMIVRIITSTGSGLEKSSPWHIIYPEHADDILNIMEVQPGRHITMTNEVEFISCANTPDRTLKGYYFNYAQIYKRMDYLDGVDMPKRKLKINPTSKK